MSKGGPFNYVGGLRPHRYKYNLSHTKLFSCDLGDLIPAFAIETVPGDKFKISNQIVIRTQPLYAPILQDVKVFTEYFFVPYRILWDDFENFLTGGKDGSFSGAIPLWNNGVQGQNFNLYSLMDYFGLPVGKTFTDQDQLPTAFLQLAYNRIWNEYYRDETIDDEVDESTQYNILKRRWKKDYFTSALPFQQRGAAAGFSFGLVSGSDGYIGDIEFSKDYITPASNLQGYSTDTTRYFATDSDANGYSLFGSGSTLGWTGGNRFGSVGGVQGSDQISPAKAKYINDSLKIGVNGNASNNFIDIAMLRLSFQIQKYLERNARAGYRYNEFLLAHYGIAPRDSVLQRPEYIGGSRSSLLVSEVLQTSETTESSPQGNLAGRGISASSEYISQYTCSEFGCIIGLFSCMPSNLYDSQGIHKMFMRKDRFDFYSPEFAHLSEQPILNREIYFDALSNPTGTFGFQPIYQEYRHMRNIVVSDFRPSVPGGTGIYANYTFARSFSSTPTLSSDFLACNPDSGRIFAVNSERALLVNFGNVVSALRPITKYSDPGLVDHF